MIRGSRFFCLKWLSLLIAQAMLLLHGYFQTADSCYVGLHEVSGLDAAFASDIAAAKKITMKDLQAKPGFLARLLMKVGFGQLNYKL